jgi:hypothetical protein
MNPQRHYALLVGLSQYPAVGNLKGPINDLTNVNDWLTNNLQVPTKNIIPWPDKPPKYRRPTDADFIDWLLEWDDLAKAGNPPLGERIYIYYAGHGINATTGQQCMVMPRTRATTWSVVPMIPLRESVRLRAYFEEVIVVFDACRDVLSYAPDGVWVDKPSAAPSSGRVKVFSAFASKAGKKAKEIDFGGGKWGGVLTQAFLTGARGYAADEHDVVYAHNLRAYLYAAVKDKLGADFEPDIDDGVDPGTPWELFRTPQRLPKIIIKPERVRAGTASLRKRSEAAGVAIDLATGIQGVEVPYGYYVLTLPSGAEIDVTAAWEEKLVEV